MDILLLLVSVTVFALMFSIGVNQSWAELTSTWRRPAVILRSLLSAVVVLPAVVFALLWLFDLPPAVATGLAVLAAAPGAPMTTKRSMMAGADLAYVSSLQLTLALSAVVITPLILSSFYSLASVTIAHVSPWRVAAQVAQVTFLPVVLALVLKHFAPNAVAKIAKPLNVLANLLFLLVVLGVIGVVAFVPEVRANLAIGWPSMAVILVVAMAAVAIGHALGGPGPSQRAGLAIATLARNVGLALYIIGLDDAGAPSTPAIIAYMLLGSAVALPYSLWIKRRVGQTTGLQAAD